MSFEAYTSEFNKINYRILNFLDQISYNYIDERKNISTIKRLSQNILGFLGMYEHTNIINSFFKYENTEVKNLRKTFIEPLNDLIELNITKKR